MIELRPFETLGAANHGWLDARHHFSFSSYMDRKRMNWGALRVWNDDRIAAQSGFAPHPHRDMEIITYVRSGAISHQDSLGNRGRTGAGDVQVMSAGTGVVHSEFNLESEDTTLFQIWISPDRAGGPPDWSARKFPKPDRGGHWTVLASGLGDDGALPIRASARVLGVALDPGQSATIEVDPRRHQYLVSASGTVDVNGIQAAPRDGVAITGESRIVVKAGDQPCELVMTDTL